jgi:ribosomal protein L29
MSTIAKQNVVAVSITAKTFIADSTADFFAPSKSKEKLNASEREIVDGLVRFVELYRYAKEEQFETEVDEETGEVKETGNIIETEVDYFEKVMAEVMAERMENVRTNGTAVKLKNLEAEAAELRAELAKLRGETPAPAPEA